MSSHKKSSVNIKTTSKPSKGKLERGRSNKNESRHHRVFSIKATHNVTKTGASERNTSANLKRKNALQQRISTHRAESPDTMPRCSSADTINITEKQDSLFINTDQSPAFKSDRSIDVHDTFPIFSPSRDTSSLLFSAIHGRERNSRNNSPVTRLDTRNNSAVLRDDTEARNEYPLNEFKDTKPRFNSARGDKSRNNSAGYAKSRTYSSTNSGGSGWRNNSAVKRPRTTSAVYRTDETRDGSRAGSPNKIEDEIILGNRISTPSGDSLVLEETHIPINTEEKQGLITNYERNIDSAQDSRCSPRCVDRTNLHSRCSSLMLGSGRVNVSDDTETVQLHFDKADYSNLLDYRMSHVRSVTISRHTTKTPNNSLKETKLSPRPVAVSLPKTFITKSGSLMLYSDNKVIKDKVNQNQQKSKRCEGGIQVKGHKMSPRTLVPQAYPYWGKHVHKKKISPNSDNRSNTGCSKRDQREYIGINKSVDDKPYSWDYAVLPVTLITEEDKSEDNKSITTVNNLSEAVLAYRSTLPSSQDKYLAMMKQTSNGETKSERVNKFQAMQMKRISTWTKEWVGRQTSVGPIACKTVKDDETDSLAIERLRKSLNQSLRCHEHVNTPLIHSDMHF